jgi:hypothetical protein
MKITHSMKSIISFFLLSLLLVDCKNDITQNNENNFIKTPENYYFQLGSYVNSDTLFADSALITIDGKYSGYTNWDGIIKIDSLNLGQHQVTVSHKYFELYENQLVVGMDSTLFVDLVPKVVEYFPLDIGVQWVYNFHNSFSFPGGASWQKGKYFWNIDKEEVDNNRKIFNVKWTYQEVETNDSILDTGTGQFTIIEADNHRVTIENVTYVFGSDFPVQMKRFFSENYLYRYYFKDEKPDTFIIVNLGDITIAKNKGLIGYKYFVGGNFTTQSNLYTLDTLILKGK